MSRSLLLLTVFALSLFACKFQEGDPCNEGEGLCDSDTAALFCSRDNTFKVMLCRGKTGCNETKDGEALCDVGIFQAGDTCPPPYEGLTQCDAANVNAALRCVEGIMQPIPCKDCAFQRDQIMCRP